MAPQKLQKLPIGVQSFEQLRTGNYLYVDKTEQIYNLATSGIAYFLSRPRRFGKSMLCSTFKALFEGKKNLFEGTWIASSDWEWKAHPVIYLSFTSIPHATPAELICKLQETLGEIAHSYGINLVVETPGNMLRKLIQQLSSKEKVVMLVDEYDKPLIRYLQNPSMVSEYRNVLKAFYESIKDCGELMRFLFLTGVSQFSKLSIFSELNHLNNLSSDPHAATICGYTQKELEYTFASHLIHAEKKFAYSHEQMLGEIKNWYNGYCFTIPTDAPERVYNPFSVLNFFNKLQFENYWFESGTPTFVIDYFKQHEFSAPDFENVRATKDLLSAIIPEQLNLTTVLYQTGYLTIKSYADRQFILGYPNQEVAESCSLALAQFINPALPNALMTQAMQLSKLFSTSNVTEVDLVQILKAICAEIPYSIAPGNERGYQTIFWLVLRLSGLNINIEEPTALGRIDAVITTNNHVYVIELKIRGTADQALEQIRTKRYAEKYAATEKPVICIGIVFDVQQRTITECKII